MGPRFERSTYPGAGQAAAGSSIPGIQRRRGGLVVDPPPLRFELAAHRHRNSTGHYEKRIFDEYF